MSDLHLALLRLLGFTPRQLALANEYCCGTMTIEGAPHIREEHLPVFDCASRCGRKGTRFTRYQAHIHAMPAAQPFLPGAISNTINMPPHATASDGKEAFRLSPATMLKGGSDARHGRKREAPAAA